jgi:tetratricopeptide (TPR) repeat protein
MWLGSIYLERRQPAEAIRQFAAIAQEDPQHFAAQAEIAHSMLMLGDLDRGMEQLKVALALREPDPLAHILAARYLTEAGLLKQAAEQYQITQKYDPGNEAARAGLESLRFMIPDTPALPPPPNSTGSRTEAALPR